MSVAHFTPSMMARGSARWLLLGSLALNLFFIGIAIAMAVRPAASPSWDRNVFVRVERLAGSLPPADGDLLRGQIKTNRASIENTQAKYRAAQDTIRAALRLEPFDVTALQAAMAQTRAARQNFDQAVQGVFATSAAQMSQVGRRALADWPPRRNTANSSQ
jgi:uncharacterized membrane protein